MKFLIFLMMPAAVVASETVTITMDMAEYQEFKEFQAMKKSGGAALRRLTAAPAESFGPDSNYEGNSIRPAARPRCDRNAFEKHFYHFAKKLTPVTDKVTTHQYEVMYGIFLVPLRFAAHRPKIMEIGLGCDGPTFARDGPGASVKVWQSLLPQAELWEAEYDKSCVAKARQAGLLQGINTVTGDQGDLSTLRAWKKEMGGDFDVIIDDGGHKQTQIGRSFDALWPLVKRGGVYVVEDLQVARTLEYDDTNGHEVFVDKIKDWTEQLLSWNPGLESEAPYRMNQSTHKVNVKFPIPEDVSFIFCQLEACVIGKHNSEKGRGVPDHVGHDFRLRARRY
jgi:hypothetical protein